MFIQGYGDQNYSQQNPYAGAPCQGNGWQGAPVQGNCNQGNCSSTPVYVYGFPPQQLTRRGFTGTQNYQSIKAQCLSAKRLFEDPEFPPDFASIAAPDLKNKQIVWKRPYVLN